MSESQTSYRQVMKATSIFGGVQVFNIIVNIIRSKFVAVLLGPAGMGIAGLLGSTLGLIGGLTNFGLGTSAVKDIAAANETGDTKRISTIVTVFRHLVWITGLLGSIVTLVLAPWLSQLTFGNKEYSWAFIWISITLLLNQISSGQGVLLRGMRQIRYMTQSGMIGSVLGLLTTVPLYYFYGVKGVVPGIIVTSVTSLLLTWYFSRKIKIETIPVTKDQTVTEGREMLKMGFLISMSGLISMGVSYVITVFISRTGSVADVGLYNAGFAIINTYVGLIFTAMGTDYYPRLSGVAHSNELCKQTINHQAEIALLLLAPILIAFLVFINWVVILLYSNKFIAVNAMIYWAALGMFFKASSWAIGFLFLAKGDSRVFFWSELAANFYILIFNIIGYHFWALTGLGLSFMAAYIVYLIQIFVVSKIKYEFSFDPAFKNIFLLQFGLAIFSFLAVKFLPQPYPYIVGLILISISFWYSYRELDKRLDLKSIVGAVKNRFRN